MIECLTLLLPSRESSDLRMDWLQLDILRLLRSSLETTSFQLLIRLLMRLPSIDTDQGDSFMLDHLLSDLLGELSAMELSITRSHLKLTLLIPLD